jgi:hypothetical protein
MEDVGGHDKKRMCIHLFGLKLLLLQYLPAHREGY